ncbi:cupredoxin domain-containing protein [Natronorubrum sp. FCH18a]|uniref:cupredoxin domain-containing protein n=1 Tax=Natronorubrum sp. FCH18a TaxID=3447018 RepID=UPI003F515115
MAPYSTDRRTLLSGVAGTLTVVSAAGCLGTDSNDGREDDEPDPVVDEAEFVEGDVDPDAWRDVEEIRFDGHVGGWVGVEPAAIDRVENPTLVLEAGREYELTWENMDGIHHNIAFWDDDREVVDGYSTDGNETVGETETLAFEATPEMATYRCEYQPEGQVGDVLLLEDADDAS